MQAPTAAEVTQKDISLRNVLVESGHWKCCLNCCEWGAPDNNQTLQPLCRKYNMVPPPKVIVLGCVEHMPDIPF
ncbi:hypothetical protein [Pseudomonas virus PBPA162]|uniref:Uncharacterized protein n=1 Tax=Pseudomonas virus PBPA162 TaxID=2588096 RepID=A0A4Y5TQI7_9CAUD|nr:hypothetical protein PQC32_gp07 [Pseudomonas virus PBPA162]QDB70841.1 hypothetical protein [Pseudomonas virus PBPA162]